MPEPEPEDVDALADEYWDHHRSTAQLWNVDRGDVTHVERWEDLSPAGLAERMARLRTFARRADAASAGAEPGSRPDVLSAAVAFGAGSAVARLPYTRDLALVAGPFSLATYLRLLVPDYRLVTTDHGAGYVAKLRALPSFLAGWADGLLEGVAAGRVATARGVRRAVADLGQLAAGAPAGHPLAAQPPPQEAGEREAAAWREEVERAVGECVQPALAALVAVLHDEVLPVARSDERAGIGHLPGGEDDYAALLWASTSLPSTAAAIHELGLARLEALDAEYRELGPATLGTSDPATARDRVRADPSLRYAGPGDIVADATAALGRAQAEARRWFVRLPRAGCTAVAVDAGPMAFYTEPSPDGRRGGTFFFNTADPASWSRAELEVTTFHEAVPGHHLQAALARERGVHPVLGELENDSFSEGWALYAERLADEMGLYSSPLQRLGMVNLDSLRAARLVVDTGIHALGWPRQRAVDFLLARTALVPAVAEAEVDRYVADPGQAVSYLVGCVELRRLRRRAESGLGAAFDIGRFHDLVLGDGAAPFPALARSLESWLRAGGGRGHTAGAPRPGAADGRPAGGTDA